MKRRYTVNRAPMPEWARGCGLELGWAVYLDGRVIHDGFDRRAEAREWARNRNAKEVAR